MITADQARQALNRANQVKLETATLRAQIRIAGRRAGARYAIDAIEDRRASITFYRLLVTVHGIGDRTARTMLFRAAINPESRLSSDRVTPRQRNRLIGQLLAYGEGSRP